MNRIVRAAAAIAALALVAANDAAAQIEWKDEHGVGAACGGVGAEERAALRALESRANLKLLLVTAKRGGYLADVDLALYVQGASAPRLELRAQGPICLFRVPAGNWRIEARRANVLRTTRVPVAPVTGLPLRAVLAFPEETWDGVRASTAEKRQAREP